MVRERHRHPQARAGSGDETCPGFPAVTGASPFSLRGRGLTGWVGRGDWCGRFVDRRAASSPSVRQVHSWVVGACTPSGLPGRSRASLSLARRAQQSWM